MTLNPRSDEPSPDETLWQRDDDLLDDSTKRGSFVQRRKRPFGRGTVQRQNQNLIRRRQLSSLNDVLLRKGAKCHCIDWISIMLVLLHALNSEY